jgi:CTP:molybdopterin cytidylyltransferase MocA
MSKPLSLWHEMRPVRGDVGCRAVIRGRPGQVAALPHVGRKGHPTNIDTIEDYQHLIGAAD